MADIETKRHSLAHILAMAVLDLYPDTKLGIGPTIENGFYYDFSFSSKEVGLHTVSVGSPTSNDLPIIEKKMKELLKKDFKFEREEVTPEKAKKIFENQPYKLELLRELKKEEKTITIYCTCPPEIKNCKLEIENCFVDLCAGPHVDSTKDLRSMSFKLTKIAGAYWKGSEKNPMLTRIYGIAFETKKELDEYFKNLEEAGKRDHRIIGKNLDLFVFSELVGKGLPLFTEKGSVIRRELERFIVDEEIKRGYKHVYTPDIARVELYKTSGHYPYYKDSMYPVMKVDNEELILRPMTCPHHFQLYASKPRTYKELPVRIAELAKQFRYEKSGELTGLMRVRSFCLADAHIICRKDQAIEEINRVLDLIEYSASALNLKKGVDYRYRLSLGDRNDEKKYYKDDAAWDFAENILRNVLKKRKEPSSEAPGEAAFYGPKIDIQMKNFAGKEDTSFTVQYDFVMPKRFKLSYIDKDGLKKEPIVIHRSSIGAIERVIAFLIEKYGGAFPVWFAPIQAEIIPVSEKFNDYGKKIFEILEKENLRSEIDISNETLGKKIREAELQKIPYILVVGDKEEKSETVAVRQRGKGDLGAMKMKDFLAKIKKEIEQRSI